MRSMESTFRTPL